MVGMQRARHGAGKVGGSGSQRSRGSSTLQAMGTTKQLGEWVLLTKRRAKDRGLRAKQSGFRLRQVEFDVQEAVRHHGPGLQREARDGSSDWESQLWR